MAAAASEDVIYLPMWEKKSKKRSICCTTVSSFKWGTFRLLGRKLDSLRTSERYKCHPLSVSFIRAGRESPFEVFSPGLSRHIKMNDGNISSATELTLLHFYAPREITVSVAAENDY